MTTLASLFNSKSQSIYSKFSNPNIPVEIKPDTAASRSRIKDDSRLLPVVSVQRDTSRISKFLKSNDGVLFIGKQLLLQTGNTFAETRLYNPLEALINVVPAPLGRHFPRHLGKPNPEIKNPTRTNRGALQKETLDSFTSPAGNVFARIGTQVLKTVTSPVQALLIKPISTNYFDDDKLEFYVRPEDNEKWYPRLLPNQSLSERGKKKPVNIQSYIDPWYNPSSLNAVGDNNTFIIYNQNLLQSPTRPRITAGNFKKSTYLSYIQIENGVRKLDIRASGFRKKDTQDLASAYTTHRVDTTGITAQYIDYKKQTNTKTTQKFRTPAFSYLESTNSTNGYFYGPKFQLTPQEDGTPVNHTLTDVALKNAVGNINDFYNLLFPKNLTSQGISALQQGNIPYSIIQKEEKDKSDIIKFTFKDTTSGAVPIHFRALISSIKQNVKPEYNEQRYVGRTERFVTYAGAKRSVTMTFNVVAFSPTELDAVWLRINHLTGLAFPKTASPSGFMVPPLFKITVGGIYEDQPCYIENLDFDFLDDTITFDIDNEVSQVINVNMTLTLLEKRSKYYDSPFYAISEKLTKQLYANQLASGSAVLIEPPPVFPPLAIVNIPDVQIPQNFSEVVYNDFTGPAADLGAQFINREQERANRATQRSQNITRETQEITQRRQAELNKIYEENQRLIISGEIPPVEEFCMNEVDYEQCVTYYNQLFRLNEIESLKRLTSPAGIRETRERITRLRQDL